MSVVAHDRIERAGHEAAGEARVDEILVGWVPGDTRVVPGYGPLTTLRGEMQKNAHLQKLSSRWTAYDDTQTMRRKIEERERKLRDDPYGDGLPF